ncbi:Hypothetical protein FKW44_011392, partial [Caligus rogercresseyi]
MADIMVKLEYCHQSREMMPRVQLDRWKRLLDDSKEKLNSLVHPYITLRTDCSREPNRPTIARAPQ